jgi:hypothetical protein
MTKPTKPGRAGKSGPPSKKLTHADFVEMKPDPTPGAEQTAPESDNLVLTLPPSAAVLVAGVRPDGVLYFDIIGPANNMLMASGLVDYAKRMVDDMWGTQISAMKLAAAAAETSKQLAAQGS